MNNTIKRIKKYKELKADIKELEIKIEEIESEVIGISSFGNDEKTGSTNKFSSAVESQVMLCDKKITPLRAAIKKKEIEIKRIDNALSVLDLEEREVINMIQIENMKYYMVQEKLHRSYPGIKKIENRAINKMKKYIF